MIALSLIVALGGGAIAGAAGAPSGCDALAQQLRNQMSAERQGQLAGASDDDGPVIEVERAVRACFRDRVVPRLELAKSDDTQIGPAFGAYLTWFREAQLLGFSDTAFEAETELVDRSLTIAFENGYAKARDRCRSRSDVAAAKKLRELFTGSAIVSVSGDALFPRFREDVARCMPRATYLITVRERSTESKGGVVGEMTYIATVTATRKDSTELVGAGSYSGFIISTPNCIDGEWVGKRFRFAVSGKLDATAFRVDWSAIGGPKNGLQYILGTLDWPLKPLFAGDAGDAYASTAEDKEIAAGMGTTGSDVFALTDPVTTLSKTDSKFGGECVGTVTETSEVRVERLGAR